MTRACFWQVSCKTLYLWIERKILFDSIGNIYHALLFNLQMQTFCRRDSIWHYWMCCYDVQGLTWCLLQKHIFGVRYFDLEHNYHAWIDYEYEFLVKMSTILVWFDHLQTLSLMFFLWFATVTLQCSHWSHSLLRALLFQTTKTASAPCCQTLHFSLILHGTKEK